MKPCTWCRERWLLPVAEDKTVVLPVLVFRRMRILLGLSLACNGLLVWAWATQARVRIQTGAIARHAASLGEITLRFEETYAAQLDDLISAQAAYQDALTQSGSARTQARARYLAAMDRFNARSDALTQIRTRLRRDAVFLHSLIKEGKTP
jgi:hypothetical protein